MILRNTQADLGPWPWRRSRFGDFCADFWTRPASMAPTSGSVAMGDAASAEAGSHSVPAMPQCRRGCLGGRMRPTWSETAMQDAGGAPAPGSRVRLRLGGLPSRRSGGASWQPRAHPVHTARRCTAHAASAGESCSSSRHECCAKWRNECGEWPPELPAGGWRRCRGGGGEPGGSGHSAERE
jgi:hypothetical protein